MKRLLKLLLSVSVLVGLVLAAYVYGKDYLPLHSQREFRTVAVSEGRIVSIVTATGSIRPMVTVSVGAFVSGQIKEIYADFNDEVQAGQLLAQIDPRTYESIQARDKATLATAKADHKRVEALLEQARRNEARQLAVKKDGENFVSAVELDQVKYQRMSLEAQLEAADAAIMQAEAMLQNSTANLNFCKIIAPVAGRVIDRKIEPGQTLAAQFQVPQLFEIAQDLDKKMRIIAAVDESDIGIITAAWQQHRPARFTVDAYPDQVFEGKVVQIRSSSTSRESIVTYPVIIETPNTESKLLAGMTASLEFETQVTDDCLRIPNSAFRFVPKRDQIEPTFRAKYDPNAVTQRTVTSLARRSEAGADESAQRVQRIVWVKADNHVRPVEIEVGVSNQEFAQLVSGDLHAGDELVDAVLSE